MMDPTLSPLPLPGPATLGWGRKPFSGEGPTEARIQLGQVALALLGGAGFQSFHTRPPSPAHSLGAAVALGS